MEKPAHYQHLKWQERAIPWSRRILPLLLCLLTAAGALGQPKSDRPTEPLTTAAQLSAEDAEFLDTLQQRTFKFFWETTNPDTGLVLDRYPSPSPSSIAAIGFGLTAYGVGAERGWIARDQAAERVLSTLRFLWNAPQGAAADATGHRGFFYHFLDIQSGRRWRHCELSSIDTALLMAGVLFCQEYFARNDAQETEIRRLADQLYRRVEWRWMQPRAPLICMSWRPERGFSDHDYRGYNEAMLLYLLALGSPTHPIDPAAWQAFTSTYQWADYYDQPHINFGPLFGHQYSHIWIDFRGIQDPYTRTKGIDYFENSRRATYAQRAYAIANPQQWRGYREEIWGLTACDGPVNAELPYAGEQRQFHSYWARGASHEYVNDDGTIAPTAAGGSLPFAPEITLPALQAMHTQYGEHLFKRYGFLDSFNPSFDFADVALRHGSVVADVGWFADDYLGIDQGPILLMAENYRNGLIWNVMRNCEYLQEGLRKAGFSGGWLSESSR